MSPDFFRGISVVFVAWGIAVALKAGKALRAHEPYTFGIWDGGMFRAGKRLTRVGTQIKLGVGLLISASFVVLLAGLRSRTVVYIAWGVLAISVISDLVNKEK